MSKAGFKFEELLYSTRCFTPLSILFSPFSLQFFPFQIHVLFPPASPSPQLSVKFILVRVVVSRPISQAHRGISQVRPLCVVHERYCGSNHAMHGVYLYP